MHADFRFMDKNKAEEVLPILFDLLYANMSKIVPTENSYEEDKTFWFSCVAPALQREKRQIVLMYVDDVLAGYFQYYISDKTFVVEELQIKPVYQRTRLLYYFYKFMQSIVPKDTMFIEAYAQKPNKNSQSVIRSLGMECVGENKTGLAWHYKGDCQKLFERF